MKMRMNKRMAKKMMMIHTFKRQFDDRLLCYTIAADYRGLSKRWRKDDENNNEDHDEWQSRIDKGVMNAWRWWMIKKICSIIGVQADKCSTMVKEYARCMTIDAQPDRYPTTCKKKRMCKISSHRRSSRHMSNIQPYQTIGVCAGICLKIFEDFKAFNHRRQADRCQSIQPSAPSRQMSKYSTIGAKPTDVKMPTIGAKPIDVKLFNHPRQADRCQSIQPSVPSRQMSKYSSIGAKLTDVNVFNRLALQLHI